MNKATKDKLRKLGIDLSYMNGQYRVAYVHGNESSAQYKESLPEAIAAAYQMAEARQPRPADADASKLLGSGTERVEYERAVAAGAVEYSIILKQGVGRNIRREAKTLEEVAAAVLEMGVDKTLVYAINAAGRSVLILAGGKPVIQ